MDITHEVLRKSVEQIPFGVAEPFLSGNPAQIESFYARLIAGLKKAYPLRVLRELDHHGSGYASYLSLFLWPADDRSTIEHPDYIETEGILLYLSRLAPIAVYGASSRTRNKQNEGESSGFIALGDVDTLPVGEWDNFAKAVESCLNQHGVELLHREKLSAPAPSDLIIPTVFDGPYYIFDALFYWCD